MGCVNTHRTMSSHPQFIKMATSSDDPPPPYPGQAPGSFNSCPNGCESGVLTQGELKDHMIDCPLQTVECEFASAGCHTKLPRKELAKHMAENSQHHLMSATLLNLRLTRELHQKMDEKDRQIAELQKRVDKLSIQSDMSGFVCHYLVLKYFKSFQEKSATGEWYSTPVTDGLGAVKVQLEIDTNGHKPKLRHLSAKLHLSDFTLPTHLSSAAYIAVNLQMLNRLGDHDHHVVTHYAHLNHLPVKFGGDKYFPLDGLSYNSSKQTQYLKDDSLHFRLYLRADCDMSIRGNY